MMATSLPIPVPTGYDWGINSILDVSADSLNEIPYLTAYPLAAREPSRNTQDSRTLPAVPVSNRKDLYRLEPNTSTDGAFCFFVIEDQTAINTIDESPSYADYNISLIVWGDLLKMFPNDPLAAYRSPDIESAIAQATDSYSGSSSLRLQAISREPANVWRGFDVDLYNGQMQYHYYTAKFDYIAPNVEINPCL